MRILKTMLLLAHFGRRLSSFGAILMMMMIQLTPAAVSDTQVISSSTSGPQDNNNKPGRPPLSCYVCSTMDYENPDDNLCRAMKKNQQQQTAGYHPHSGMSYSQPADSPYITSTTVSSSTHEAPTTDNKQPNVIKSAGADHSSPGYYDEYATTTSATLLSSAGHHNGHPQRQFNSNSSAAAPVQSTSDNSTAIMHPSSHHLHGPTANQHHHYGYFPQGRAPAPPSDIIRTRPCLEGENFCSIVSIVRIEFVNENAKSIFWAMERNCSKSCNTGCMLIGERVRLRVCSQCCRTPNCNIGSGAASIKFVGLNSLQLIMLLLSLVSLKILLFHGHQVLR